ncbi:MAG: SAM-dependent chlorinase/fluorinase [Alphaproteobacteria bacterium]
MPYHRRDMILLFTDFGFEGPYVGQMKAVLASAAPGETVIDLMHDAPRHDPRSAAYLLAALVPDMPPGAICVAVVDPGVGGARPLVIVEADGRWFTGPGEGLFEILQRQAESARQWRIDWRPPRLSPSFHGRDLFAPVAARLARGEVPAVTERTDGWRTDPSRPGADWPDDLPAILWFDRFGNAVTGLRGASCDSGTVIRVGDTVVRHARVFSAVPRGEIFWYENSSGMVEIAVNCGSAADVLNLHAGAAIRVEAPAS